MGFWNKVKDLIGIEEEYDDEDYLEDKSNLDTNDKSFTEEETENKFNEKNSFKEEKTLRSEPKITKPVVRESSYRSYSSNSDMVVTIKEPLTYEDGKAVMDDILAGKTVVLNLEMLEMDKKTQIFYFVSGGLYSLKGSIQNVTKDIYVLVPHGVEVDGKIKESLSASSLYQL